jgi:hypothetical protein
MKTKLSTATVTQILFAINMQWAEFVWPSINEHVSWQKYLMDFILKCGQKVLIVIEYISVESFTKCTSCNCPSVQSVSGQLQEINFVKFLALISVLLVFSIKLQHNSPKWLYIKVGHPCKL